MRPIKFRCFNKGTQKMIDLHAATPLALDANLKCDGLFIPFIEGYEIMQFTGLTDNNGKDIYEGDIIDQETQFGTFRSVIAWDEKDTCFHPFYPCKWREVVGSIHENPELLPKKEDQV